MTSGDLMRAKTRRFEFSGQLRYHDIYNSGRDNSQAHSWSNLYTGIAIPISLGLFITLKVLEGQTLFDAATVVLLHPLVLIGFSVVASIFGLSKWMIIKTKNRSARGEGEFAVTRYRVDDDGLGWKTGSCEIAVDWDAVECAKIDNNLIQIVLAAPHVGGITIPKRWFESEPEGWDELNVFVNEKTVSNAT